MTTRFAWAVLAAATLAAGCGTRSFPAPPKTYPVQGTITADGRPLSGGHLVCVLTTNTDRYGNVEAPAEVKPGGAFEPRQFGDVPGLYPGRWKVVVRPTKIVNGKAVRIAEPVPAKYTKEETSDLYFDVTEGENTVVLALR
jgi:hypothetical protein